VDGIVTYAQVKPLVRRLYDRLRRLPDNRISWFLRHLAALLSHSEIVIPMGRTRESCVLKESMGTCEF
jgi:hypothetical protein